jgi:16S rRNA (adenine1518-N6/adenine1519-N6)-dimethyltransferase
MDDSLIGKKSLGQHWLNDEHSLDAIASSINLKSDDTVLEVGPGLGALTSKLVRQAKKVVAVELDREVIVYLQSNLKSSNLEIVNENILDFDLTSLPAGYKVVANIPYYLTSKLLRVLNESSNPFSQAALLVQKEVAERVAAEPGKMSLLSVSVQYYCQVSLGKLISADKFTPPPKVDSQVLILKTRDEPLFPEVDSRKYFQLVKAGFSQRRKTLVNSLSGGLRIERPEAGDLIERAGLTSSARPQTLSLEDWQKLYQSFY